MDSTLITSKLTDVFGGRLMTGLSAPVRTDGQKGNEQGNILTQLPIVGVCELGSSNPYTARAKNSMVGGFGYVVIADRMGIIRGSRPTAPDKARDRACQLLSQHGVRELAKLTPAQIEERSEIVEVERTLRKLYTKLNETDSPKIKKSIKKRIAFNKSELQALIS